MAIVILPFTELLHRPVKIIKYKLYFASFCRDELGFTVISQLYYQWKCLSLSGWGSMENKLRSPNFDAKYKSCTIYVFSVTLKQYHLLIDWFYFQFKLYFKIYQSYLKSWINLKNIRIVLKKKNLNKDNWYITIASICIHIFGHNMK